MMGNLLRFAGAFVFLIGFTTSLAAQDRCLTPLIRAKPVLNVQDASNLALVRLIEGATTIRSQPMSDGTVAFSDVNLASNYKDAKIFADLYFQNTRFHYSPDKLNSAATQFFPLELVKNYYGCMAGGEQNTIIITAHDAGQDFVMITVSMTVPSTKHSRNRSRGRKANQLLGRISIAGGMPQTPFPEVWHSGDAVSRKVRRFPDSDINVAANIGGNTETSIVSWVPRIHFAHGALVED